MTTSLEVIKDAAAIERAGEAAGRAAALLLEARAVTITSPPEAQIAADLRNQINMEEKHSEAARDALVRPLNEHVRWINAQFKPASATRQDALDILRRKLTAWDDEQRKVVEDARREAAEKLRKEEERLRRQAEKAEEKGNAVKAETLLAKAEELSLTPIDLPAPEAPEGITYRTSYRAEIVDLGALLKAVLAGIVPPGAIIPDMKFINATARATQGQMNWPGVRVVADRKVAAR